jgi:uncharacterized cupin superfamily protein
MQTPEPLQRPALDPASVPDVRGSGYPEPFRSRMGDRVKKRLGEVCGLTQFGVNLVTLGPSGQSALRHWHTLEDEFVFILSGEVTLVSNQGQQILKAGMCAGYPAGERDAHHFINHTDQPVQYLEIGSRIPGDVGFYPDDDLLWIETEEGTVGAHKNGEFYLDG